MGGLSDTLGSLWLVASGQSYEDHPIGNFSHTLEKLDFFHGGNDETCLEPLRQRLGGAAWYNIEDVRRIEKKRIWWFKLLINSNLNHQIRPEGGQPPGGR
jgi:hypothetical protein